MIPVDMLRSLQGLFMPDSATIQRYVEESTSDGVEHVWSDVATEIPCRVSSNASLGMERPGEGAAIRSTSQWVVWLPAFTDVQLVDRIVVTGGDRTDGRTFEVSRVDEKSYETARRVSCVLFT